DRNGTGVQTGALPILAGRTPAPPGSPGTDGESRNRHEPHRSRRGASLTRAERGGWMSPEEGARSVWLATAGAGAVMLRSRAVTKGSFARGWAHRSVRRRICDPG